MSSAQVAQPAAQLAAQPATFNSPVAPIATPAVQSQRVFIKDLKKQRKELASIEKSLKSSRPKKERTAEQVEKDKAKMAALRAKKAEKRKAVQN